MRIYTLHGAPVATANNIVSVEIAQSGTIRGIQINATSDLDAADEGWDAELSLVPYLTTGTNDSVGALAVVGELSSGASAKSGVNVAFPCACPVKNGDRIYMNAVLTGSGQLYLTALITVI